MCQNAFSATAPMIILELIQKSSMQGITGPDCCIMLALNSEEGFQGVMVLTLALILLIVGSRSETRTTITTY